ncbi:hypothetical protein [Tahibacter sp.]|uniref:LVIVD repeat-containing protein n=1 Tax=Tahibacter sp. TaxID=2056211 RepID=UPI0028C4AAC8|nr:hypothetical protein [Tahibacter sp.]
MKTPAALFLSLLAATAAAAPPAPSTFIAARGGSVSAPVAAGTHVYLATGSTVTAWNRNASGALDYTGDSRTTPAHGFLNGLVREGDYLYASYRGYDSTISGVAVYSIADRDQPQLLGQYTYSNAGFLFAQSIAVANGYLYVLDNEQGIFASPLTSPAVPVFSQVFTGWGNFDHAFTHGNRLYTTGRTFVSGTALSIFDLSTPLAPQLTGSATLDGFDNFRLKVQPPYAYGFGLAINVTDLSDPANITPRGRIDAPVAYDGLVLGSHAWSLGLDGIDVWAIGDPDKIFPAGHAAIDTFATDATAVLDADALLATRADRFVRLDASQPATPALRGEALLPGGTAAYDITVRGDHALILGNAYGLNVARASDLAPLARFETSLEASLQGRAFEQLAVDGDRAYLTSWGSGLVIADLSNPAQPQQIGFWEYPFATAIAARGNLAYVGRSTNGGELVVLDVTNPAQPQPLGSLPTSKILRLALHGNHVFIADESPFGDKDGALIVIDVSNPAAPVEAGRYTGCGSVRDVALSANGRRALIACGTTAHLLDVSNPAQPQPLGIYADAGFSVALQGDRAFIGSETGLDEVSFANPSQPQRLQRWDLPTAVARLQLGSDARVYALTTTAGIYVYAADRLFADSLE